MKRAEMMTDEKHPIKKNKIGEDFQDIHGEFGIDIDNSSFVRINEYKVIKFSYDVSDSSKFPDEI